MGSIDIDPASNETAQRTVKAQLYYTQKTNGLNKDWTGNVWLNPPYGRGLVEKFAQKLSNELKTGWLEQAIILINCTHDTKWFKRNLAPIVTATCMPDHRIHFLDAQCKPQPNTDRNQLFLYIGENQIKFCEEFQQYGLCQIPMNSNKQDGK